MGSFKGKETSMCQLVKTFPHRVGSRVQNAKLRSER